MKTTTRLVAAAFGAALALCPALAQAQYTEIVYNTDNMRFPSGLEDRILGHKSVNRNTKVSVRHNEDGSVTYTYRTVPPQPKVGTVVPALPTACKAAAVNGALYERCGSTWYQPHNTGQRAGYVVVHPPK